MSTDLIQLRLAVRNAVNAQSEAKRDYEFKLLELKKWEQRYKLASEKGRDELANAAKFQVERFLVLSKSIKAAIDQQEPYIESLKKQLSSLEENTVLKPSNSEKSQIEDNGHFALDDLDDDNADVSTIDELYPGSTGLTLINTKDTLYIDKLDDLEAKLATLEDSQVHSSLDELVQFKADFIEEATEKQTLINPASKENFSLSKDYLLFELSEVISDIEKAISNTPNHREYLQSQYKLAWERVNHHHNEAKNALQRDSDIETIEALITKQVHKKLALVLKEQLEQQSMRLDVMKRILARLNVLEKTLRIL